MYQYLREIKDKHKGEDIYIVGSGASLSFLDMSFFDNKITIGVNRIYKFFTPTYVFYKDIRSARSFVQVYNETKNSKLIVVDSHPDNQSTHEYNTKRHYYVAEIGVYSSFVDVGYIDSNILVNSELSMPSVIHAAYLLGAKNIILCGVDGGLINGKVNIDGYYSKKEYSKKKKTEKKQSHLEFTKKTMSHPYAEHNLKIVRDELKKRGCNVVSLNPFVNLGLEGNKYKKHEIPTDELWCNEINEQL